MVVAEREQAFGIARLRVDHARTAKLHRNTLAIAKAAKRIDTRNSNINFASFMRSEKEASIDPQRLASGHLASLERTVIACKEHPRALGHRNVRTEGAFLSATTCEQTDKTRAHSQIGCSTHIRLTSDDPPVVRRDFERQQISRQQDAQRDISRSSEFVLAAGRARARSAKGLARTALVEAARVHLHVAFHPEQSSRIGDNGLVILQRQRGEAKSGTAFDAVIVLEIVSD